MSELDDFRTKTLSRFAEAEIALHSGDPEPRLAMWSDQDPMTLFGARGPCKSGWDQVSPVFHWLASRSPASANTGWNSGSAGLER